MVAEEPFLRIIIGRRDMLERPSDEYFIRGAGKLDNWTARKSFNWYGYQLDCWYSG